MTIAPDVVREAIAHALSGHYSHMDVRKSLEAVDAKVFRREFGLPRLRFGLTQERLAKAAGLDVRTIRNCETGRHRPTRFSLAKLREVLDIGP